MPDKHDGLGRELDNEAEQQEMQLDDLDMDDGEGEKEDEEEWSDDDLDTQQQGDAHDSGSELSVDDQDQDETRADRGGDGEETEENAEVSEDVKPEADGDEADGADEEGKDEADAAKDEADDAQEDIKDEAGEGAAEQPEQRGAEPQETEPGQAGAPETKQDPLDGRTAPESEPAAQAPHAKPQSAQRTLGDMTDDMNTDADGDGNDAGGASGAQERAAGGASDAGQTAPQTGGAPMDAGADAETHADDATDTERANPVQSLGDSLEQFRRDMAAIREARDANEPHADDGMPEAGDVEHVAHDDDADTQALGVASEQQAQAMRQLSLDEGDAPPMHEDAPEAMDDAPQPTSDAPREMPDATDASGAATGAAADGALTSTDVQQQSAEEGGVEAEHETMDPLPEEERAEADEHVEAALATFRASDSDVAHAAELWRAYSTLTMDLAFGLCEQLRLILAPTLATRLNGDFRTGKRLNLRKIIPYIASDFAKDKIWLRRTKPSAREYQVLLAIDDSKSMAEGRNIHLAYQTLALVTGALMRLEVGDVAVCRFGEQVEMLHDFGAASFSDAHGGQILSKLRFDQTSTDVHALLSSSLQTLRTARETRASASGADLWQLQIIISDGVCQDHERLRAQIRRAMAERVMLVFVVVDAAEDTSGSGPPRSSILSMNQVSYHTDGAGKLQLEMKRYIDTFPFDSYVIVRDVHALPGVLASTLRQWAEKIRDA